MANPIDLNIIELMASKDEMRESMEIIGSAGFRNLPDENGMIEIGFGIDPTF